MKTATGFPPQIFLLFIFAQCLNGAFWWFRGTAEHPEKRSGYAKLVAAWVLLGNIPWFILGAGVLEGRIISMDDVFKPNHHNPFLQAFFVSIVVILLLVNFWIWVGNGSQTLIDYPGLANRPLTEPMPIKLYVLASTIFAFIGAAVMWFSN